MIIDLQKFDAWIIQLTIAINFISSKDAGEVRAIHSTSNSIKFKPYSDANEIIGELINLLCSKY